MRCSVLIPTRDRLERLGECLEGLARQSVGSGAFEVLVGVDGTDDGERALAARVLGDRVAHEVVETGSGGGGGGGGPASARNALIERASGETLLFLNDDVVPLWDLVSRHVEAQEEIRASGRWEAGAMVVGGAPWRVEEPDRVVDRLVRETSLVFFYDQMTGEAARDPDFDWGFRHAWTLNLSIPAAAVREVGGFCEGMEAPAYEDLELAYRLEERFDMPVLYRSGAMVEHVHRYEPLGLLRREVVLGHQGHRLAEVSAACARAVFRQDRLDGEALAAARAFVEGGEEDAERTIAAWLGVAEKPAELLDGDPALVEMAFELYRTARGFLRRLGWVAAAEGRSVDQAAGWLERFAGLEGVGVVAE